jgi:hypothetical protein
VAVNSFEPSPYFDWLHVDPRGDRRIATFLNDLLLAKKLIN